MRTVSNTLKSVGKRNSRLTGVKDIAIMQAVHDDGRRREGKDGT